MPTVAAKPPEPACRWLRWVCFAQTAFCDTLHEPFSHKNTQTTYKETDPEITLFNVILDSDNIASATILQPCALHNTRTMSDLHIQPAKLIGDLRLLFRISSRSLCFQVKAQSWLDRWLPNTWPTEFGELTGTSTPPRVDFFICIGQEPAGFEVEVWGEPGTSKHIAIYWIKTYCE